MGTRGFTREDIMRLPEKARVSALRQLGELTPLAEAATTPAKKRKARQSVLVRAEVFCTRCGSYEHTSPSLSMSTPELGAPSYSCFAAAGAFLAGHGLTRFAVPLKTVNEANRLAGQHWGKKARTRKAAHRHIGAGWEAHRPALRPLLRVTMTRISNGELDSDGLQGALKAVRDEIARKLRVDDKTMLIEWAYGQERGRPGLPAVRIDLEELR